MTHIPRVLVTRPENQAESFCDLIQAAGMRPIRIPTLSIEPLDEPVPQNALDRCDLAIFISANAVEFSLGRHPIEVPDSCQLAAVGPSSAAALNQYGHAARWTPEKDYSSNGLLALPALNHVSGKQIIIFRGVGGKPLLGDTLTRRGATVRYIECYRRRRPDENQKALQSVLTNNEIDVVTLTSRACLDNLWALVDPPARENLRALPVVLISDQIEPVARSLGFRHAPIIAAECSDAGMIAALAQWQNSTSVTPSYSGVNLK